MRGPAVARPRASRPRRVGGLLYALAVLVSGVALTASVVLASVYFRRRS